MLEIDHENCVARMGSLDVRIDVGSMLRNVAMTVRAFKSGFFPTFVGQVAVKASIPLVGFSAVVTYEISAIAMQRGSHEVVLIIATCKTRQRCN